MAAFKITPQLVITAILLLGITLTFYIIPSQLDWSENSAVASYFAASISAILFVGLLIASVVVYKQTRR